jgi:glucose 1-dehydrogenase
MTACSPGNRMKTHTAPLKTLTNGKLLAGQRALVTGAASGIGAAIARHLADAGAAVVVNYVSSPEKAQALVDEIKAHGGDAVAIRADVSMESQVEDMFQEMCRLYGSIDILVNNAGLQKDAALHKMSLRDWQHVIDVNLTGQFLCARAAVREFLRRGLQPERARPHSLGRPRELRGVERRRDAADADDGAGAGDAQDPRQ